VPCLRRPISLRLAPERPRNDLGCPPWRTFLPWRTHSCVPRSHSCERFDVVSLMTVRGVPKIAPNVGRASIAIESKRSHECERGTQECVRHSVPKIAPNVGRASMAIESKRSQECERGTQECVRHSVEPERLRHGQSGVTLIELLIAVLLLSFLSLGIVLTLRVALSAMNKSDSKLMANRRVTSVERILDQEIEGIMPVTAQCQPQPGVLGPTLMFFQGEPASMRLASTYSLQQGQRGLPMILEFQVIPGENDQGVRLVVNEHWYTGPRGAGVYCIGKGGGPDGGPRFAPISIGPESFVLADKLAYCRFSFRDLRRPPEPPVWVESWIKPVLPNAIRIEMAPLAPDAGRLQPVTLTIPVHVTRLPLGPYENN
jgi:prepilin-type N-terminal cleavage/methylation domain-containing protein